VKRLSPQPAVSVWPLVTESTSACHQRHAGTQPGNPDVTPRHVGRACGTIHTRAHRGWSSARPSPLSLRSPTITGRRSEIESSSSRQQARGGEDRCCAERSHMQSVSPAIGPVTCPRRGPAARMPHRTPHGFRNVSFSPYFSSSLTLSIRGAVSPARHVLTRPRPHPFSRPCGAGTSALSRAGARRGSQRLWGVDRLRGVSRRRCQPWPREAAALSHSPAPWQSRGRAGRLCCRAWIPGVVP
jgi:hypothetical protein